MKNRVLATCLLLSSVLPAAVIRSNAEVSELKASSASTWSPLSGVLLAYRQVSMYVLTTSQNPLMNLRNWAEESLVQDWGTSLASGGYNLFTTSNSGQQQAFAVGFGADGAVVDNGPGSPMWAPGALLAEWNPLPEVPVFNRGIPAIDDFPRDMSPGGLLVGFAEDFQFVSPAVLLAGGSKATPAPSLSEFGLALRGVNPEAFGGAPSSVKSAPVQSAVPTDVATSTAAPTVLASPVASPAASGRTAVVDSPAAVPASTSAPQTIATVAEAFMTTSVAATSSGSVSGTDFARPNMIGNAIIPLDTPEPGTCAAMGLGFALVAWKARRKV